MPKTTNIAYIVTEAWAGLVPTLKSLQEQGFHFNGPEEMAAPMEEAGIPFTVQSVDALLHDLNQSSEAFFGRLFILHHYSRLGTRLVAACEALLSYVLTMNSQETLLITDPDQYPLLQDEILGTPEQRHLLSRQLYQDVRPGSMVRLKQIVSPEALPWSLYSTNPSWMEAIEVLSMASQIPLGPFQIKNMLVGTHLLLQLARTQGVHPYQAILLQHGYPVQVACHAMGMAGAVEQVLFQNSLFAPGATLVVSHPLERDEARQVAQAGIHVVISPAWIGEVLVQSASLFIPVAFHLERLQISEAQIMNLGKNTVLYQSHSMDQHSVTWHTTTKPSDAQMMDLELAVLIADHMPPCAVVLIHQQQTLSLASGMVMPMEAVEYALSHTSGETQGAVCVVTGEVYSDVLLNALIQARVAGVLLASSAQLPPALIRSLKHVPFFVGTYAAHPLDSLMNRSQAGALHE